MGRELLGGWVFCRDGRKSRRRSSEEVHPPAARQPITRLFHRAETPGSSPGSFHLSEYKIGESKTRGKNPKYLIFLFFGFLFLATESKFVFSQLIETISVEFRREYNNGQTREISEGIIYYQAAAKKATLNVVTPIRQLMQVRKNEILIYYPKEKCAFRIFSKKPLSLEFFEAFLSVMKDDYGLSEFGYKMESYEVTGRKLICNWLPPAVMTKILGPISIEFRDNRIAQIEVKKPDGKTLSNFTFLKHIQFGAIYFPLEIRISRYLPAEVITELIQYSNPRFNIPLPKEIVNLEIPADIPVKEFEW